LIVNLLLLLLCVVKPIFMLIWIGNILYSYALCE